MPLQIKSVLVQILLNLFSLLFIFFYKFTDIKQFKMSTSFDQPHLIHEDTRFKHIDREQSLTLIRQAEKIQKQKHYHSQFKYTPVERVVRDQRIAIIQQISNKLANNSIATPSKNQDISDLQVNRRVLRLQRLMDQIRSERMHNDHPKTVFVRQSAQLPSKNPGESGQAGMYESRRRGRLQQLLRQIQRARHQVREMHLWNEQVIRRSNSYRQPFFNRSNNNKYESFRTQNQYSSENLPPHNDMKLKDQLQGKANEVQDAVLTKRQSLINKLSDIPEKMPTSKDSLVVEEQFNSETVVNDVPNTQIYCPSEVILSWKKGQARAKSVFNPNAGYPTVEASEFKIGQR